MTADEEDKICQKITALRSEYGFISTQDILNIVKENEAQVRREQIEEVLSRVSQFKGAIVDGTQMIECVKILLSQLTPTGKEV